MAPVGGVQTIDDANVIPLEVKMATDTDWGKWHRKGRPTIRFKWNNNLLSITKKLLNV